MTIRKTSLVGAGIVGLLIAGLTGCSQSEALDFSQACSKVIERNNIPQCTELLAGDPALELPTGTSSAPIGAFTAQGERFQTVSGESLSISQSVMDQFENHEPYSTFVYQATVNDDSVTDVQPVLEVTEDAVMNRVFGNHTLVGMMSTLAAPGSYSFDPTAPVIVQLEAQAKDGLLSGKILNVATGIQAPDGECIAALPADATNPLQGDFTENVSIQRFPSMHAPFDDEMVFIWSPDSSGMGAEFYPSIVTLFSGEELDGPWEITQHGAPDSGPSLQLSLQPGLTDPRPC